MTPGYIFISSNHDVYVSMPYIAIDFSSGTYLQYWASNGCNLEVGTMTDPYDHSTFHLLEGVPDCQGNAWEQYTINLSRAPFGDHYITFHKVNVGHNAKLDDIRVTTTGCLVGNFRATNLAMERYENTHLIYFPGCDTVVPPVTFSWDVVGNPSVQILVADSIGQQLLYQDVTGMNTFSIQLEEDEFYYVSLFGGCDSLSNICNPSYSKIYWLKLTRIGCDTDDCVDTRMLHSTKATPYYGTYGDPYAHRVVVDFGPSSQESRHTVNIDTAMRDPIIPDLRVIPEGEDHSVRLGNWGTGSKAEAMQYDIPVDTTQYDMLILKYAAVMQDPDHNPIDQPRFRIEMLDAAGNLIAPASCNSYDFVANASLGWNTITYHNTTVLWKDWTVVGIDLSGYHGQSVRLRLTTYDCKPGAHFGYAYYTLSCAQKTINFLSCSNGDSNRVEAPDGFTYRWSRDDNDSVIGTERAITLPIDNHYYYCSLGFIGDTSCSVTLSVLSRLVAPVADFDYSVQRDSCRFKVEFIDHSHFVDDSTAQCDNAWWDFGAFGTSTSHAPVVFYPDTGTYLVRLFSSLPGDGCVDSIERYVVLSYPIDTVDTAICQAEHFAVGDTAFSVTGTYQAMSGCDTLVTLHLTVRDTSLIDTVAVACHSLLYRDSSMLTSGVYDFVYTNNVGCDSTYRLHLTVNPVYDTTSTLSFCAGHPYVYLGVDYGGPVAFDTLFATTAGCDSLVHVALVTLDSTFLIRALHSIDRQHWSDTVPIAFCRNQTLYVVDSTHSAVTWQWTLLDAASQLAETSSTPTMEFSPGVGDSIGTYSLALEVASPGGCHDSLLWPVLVLPVPEAEFGWEPYDPVDIAPEVTLKNLSQPESCQWLWLVQRTQEGAECDSLTDFEPFYRWQGDLPRGEFDVTLTASLRWQYDTLVHVCTDTVSHSVEIVTAWLQFPNLVTPDGDGYNDRWEVVNLVEMGQYPLNELWIYNSWGDLVFHATNIREHEQFWDPNERACPDGTYYYRFLGRSSHGVVRRNGVIEVVR